MRRATWWAVLVGVITLSAPPLRADERSPAAAAHRLQAAQSALAAAPDPSAVLTGLPALAADLFTLLRPPDGGRLTAAQVANLAGVPAVAWPALQGVWLPLFGGPAPTKADADLLRELGVLAPEPGPARRRLGG